MSASTKKVYKGGGKIADTLVASLADILSKPELAELQSDIFGALMDAYNAGIVSGLEEARLLAERGPLPPVNIEAFHYPVRAMRDKAGTVRFRVSRYLDSSHFSGDIVVSPTDKNYDFWLWVIHRAYKEEHFHQLDLHMVNELRNEFDALLAEFSRGYLDREAILHSIPLKER